MTEHAAGIEGVAIDPGSETTTLPPAQIPPPPITSPFDSRPQKPSVGRIVHFYPGNVFESDKGQPYPAVITHVHSDRTVNLRICQDAQHPLPVGDLTQAEVVSAEPGMSGRRWCWPPRS